MKQRCNVKINYSFTVGNEAAFFSLYEICLTYALNRDLKFPIIYGVGIPIWIRSFHQTVIGEFHFVASWRKWSLFRSRWLASVNVSHRWVILHHHPWFLHVFAYRQLPKIIHYQWFYTSISVHPWWTFVSFGYFQIMSEGVEFNWQSFFPFYIIACRQLRILAREWSLVVWRFFERHLRCGQWTVKWLQLYWIIRGKLYLPWFHSLATMFQRNDPRHASVQCHKCKIFASCLILFFYSDLHIEYWLNVKADILTFLLRTQLRLRRRLCARKCVCVCVCSSPNVWKLQKRK